MTDRRRVAIIGTRGYPSFYGGFETLLRHLVPYLAERDWDVDVYCRKGVDSLPAHTEDDPTAERITQVFTRGVESKSLSTLSFGLTSAVDAMRRDPDVALVMNVANGFWLPILKARGIPTVVNVDGIEWDRDKWGPTAKRVFMGGAKVTARYANTLIFDAEEIGRRWRDQFQRDGTFIPYGGTPVDQKEEHPEYPPRSYILYVARFVPENSVEEFIEAAQTLSSTSRVVIVGSSGYGGALEERVSVTAASNDNINWLGHISDDQRLHALWANAGAYFHGHSVGGTNPALVQAMACGAPIVARDTTYNREVLGDAAVFARPEPKHIAEQVGIVMADKELQAQLARQSIERQTTNYTWDLVCGRYEQVLASLSESSNHRSRKESRYRHSTIDNL